MNVVIATGLYPPEIGGPATYALLVEERLPPKGIAVSVVPFGLVRHHRKIIRHLVYTYKLWCQTKQADVIYALDPVSVGLSALLVATLRRKPFLIRLGGDYAWEQGRVRFGLEGTLDEYIAGLTKRPLRVRFLAFLQSFVTSRATAVVAPSEYLKRIIMSWGVREERIRVIYSALYPLTVEGTKSELHTQLSYTTPTIVSAGRLVPWKRFSALIRVVAALVPEYPDISLIIAGDGEEEDALKAEAVRLDIRDRVRFVGRVSKDALGGTIKGADIFVLNTAYEGLSHQLIEVMDLGTPVITTTAGGNPELITDGVHGLLVPFNDEEALKAAIERMLTYPEGRTRMAQTAKVRAKEFSEDVMLEKIEALLKELHAQNT